MLAGAASTVGVKVLDVDRFAMKTMMLMLPFLSSIHGSMVRIVAESAEDLAAVRFDNEEATEWARISATGAQQLSTDADIVSGGISIRQLSEELNSQVAELKLQNAELRREMEWKLWPLLPPSVLDLTATDPDLKGFRGGFTDGTYGYLVPYDNGNVHNGNVARFSLSDFSSVSVLDLTATDPDLKGFRGGFTDGTYGYMMPYYNGAYFGKVARFLLSDFSSVSVLDLTATDSDLKGFIGGFTDGTYGYLVPNNNGAAPFGKVARFSLSDFSSVSVLELTATDSDLKGFLGGFTDGTYGYLVPNNNGAAPFGKVARFSLSDFSSVSVLDLTATDSDLKGFQGGFTDGTYGYMVPHYNGEGDAEAFGKVARFSLSDFSSVSVLDLTATDPELNGFVGGFTDGTYGYLVPLYSYVVPTYNGVNYGKVARFSLSDFSSVSVLDLTATDSDLKGFRGGFTDGTYGYMVPYQGAGGYFGKVARFSVVSHTQGIGWTSSP